MLPWSSAGMAQVAEIVRRRTGLVFPESRIADFEAAVRRAMARSGVREPSALVELLERDPAARDALVAEVTVGESYFQRDAAQFEFLRRHALPQLLEARAGERPVRVWSAGCAAGEEPYSVAMLFDELDALDEVEIVGTDISRPRLADAQRGVYSRWALRNTPDSVRDRYFRPRGRYYELTRRIRERAEFRYLNLAEDEFPSFSSGIWGMDLILCRNVLIYFDEATIERVARRLLATLTDDGWLVLGASDPAMATRVPCDVVMTDSGWVYRRAGTAQNRDLRTPRRPPPEPEAGTVFEPVHDTAMPAPGLEPPIVAPRLEPQSPATGFEPQWPAPEVEWPAPELEPSMRAAGGPSPPAPSRAAHPAPLMPDGDAHSRPLLAAYAQRDFETVCRIAETRSATLSALEYIAWVRALANRGHRDAAREAIAHAIESVGETPELLYLDAVLQLEAGNAKAAAEAARRALYLDRGFIVAHMALANARQRLQDRAGARRSLQNAASLLKGLPPDSLVPGADGETAERLAELIRMNLRMLS